MSSNHPLYGVPRPNAGLKPTKEIPLSSTSLAFTSQLSSLLAQSSSSHPSSTTNARPRSSKTSKEDIFRSHNKNTKKRALADISSSSDGHTQGRQRQGGSGLEREELHRSKRKMEEKARLYAAMKRGDYVPPAGRNSSHNLEEHALVDFDRKWADELERDRNGGTSKNNNDNDDNNDDTSSGEDNCDDDDDDDGGGGGDNEQVTYTDEFGRLRPCTRRERARHLRRQNASIYASSQLESFSARPAPPSTTLIHGDVIQSSAFNPDITIAAQMDELARKRDRSLTPPLETHYDASKEIRSKGVGFYQFSTDEESRKREMGELEGMRGETERVKMEQEERRERRRREVEGRKRVILKKREERLADRFLAELG
ncbi:MAG: hypothetical protein L6R42_007276 [Xanthoria sp. 1 TBL-2021]|nr:MAG: hypothetical protein L6R42_007276 [Xanthoria sp. 1 TBL-2021]